MHTDSVDTEGSSPTVRDISADYEMLEEKMYRSEAFRIWMRFIMTVIFCGIVYLVLPTLDQL